MVYWVWRRGLLGRPLLFLRSSRCRVTPCRVLGKPGSASCHWTSSPIVPLLVQILPPSPVTLTGSQMRGVQGAQVARTPLPEMRALLGGAPGGKPLGEGLREEGMEVSWPFHPRAHLPHTCQPGPSGPHPEPAPSLAPRCGRLPRGPALVSPLLPAAAAAEAGTADSSLLIEIQKEGLLALRALLPPSRPLVLSPSPHSAPLGPSP